MLAIDRDSFSSARQNALLLHSLGVEGQKRFANIKEQATYPEDATDLQKTVLKLEKDYRKCKNKRSERYTFRKRAQLQGESITDYVAVLWDLASTCQFNTFTMMPYVIK